MRKVTKTISAVTGRVLFIGFSIQIILGICWMIGNITGFQKFGESILYEEISKTLICDEYEGILYPVLIMITKGMEELILVPYHFILYLLQIGFAFFVSVQLVTAIGVREKVWKIWGALVLLTFPLAMQSHLAVLTDSFGSSLLLLELAVIATTVRKEHLCYGDFVKVLVCWVAVALLKPEYFYIGAVPVAVSFLYGLVKTWRNDKKRILTYTVLLAAFAGLILLVGDVSREEGYYGRTSGSIQAHMASRLGWPYAGTDYAFWPQEVKEQFTLIEAMEIDYYADNTDRILGRTLERELGEERAEDLLGEIARIAWQNHRGEILYRTVWDALGYTFSPAVLQRQFSGKIYDSYSGMNYDIMRAQTPYLTKYYMDYGCWWFCAGLMLTALMQGLSFAYRLAEKWRHKSKLQGFGKTMIMVTCCVLTSGVLVLLYTLRGAGMMDYKKSIAVTLLWIWWMLFSCVRGIRAEE